MERNQKVLFLLGCLIVATFAVVIVVSPARAETGVRLLFTRRTSDNARADIILSDGQNETNLTGGIGYNDDASWSPDGAKIVFMSTRSGEYQVWVMDADGGNPHRISDGSNAEGEPSWSPDGTRIAYASNGNIFVRNTDGSGMPVRLTANGLNNSGPQWSPDGTKIAYGYYNGRGYISVMNADGSNVVNLTATTNINASSPAWSPDGNRVAFAGNVLGDGFHGTDIYIVGADGGNLADVTPPPPTAAITDQDPVWSLDGSAIIYASTLDDPNALRHIYSMDLTGSTPVRLTNDASGVIDDLHPSVGAVPVAATTTTTEIPTTTSHPASTTTTTSVAQPVKLHYVALGDSVSSGEGLNYGWKWVEDANGRDGTWQETGPSNPQWDSSVQGCHRASGAYPDLVAQANGYVLTKQSCTGASAASGLLCTQSPQNVLQLGSRKGVCGVSAAYDAAQPDIVSITVGADDVDFSDFVTECYAPATSSKSVTTCDTKANTRKLEGLLKTQKANLATVLQEIDTRGRAAGKIPRVYLTTYYDPFPDTYTVCRDIGPLPGTGLAQSEFHWLKQELALLNANIRYEAAQFGNVTLVDLEHVMDGHRFCSADPWVFGPSISFQPNQRNSPAPFHPTSEGQGAIADKVIERIS